jgi:mannose-6-phosphate isomerase
MEQRIFRLTGKVQHYAWGGYDFIPSLLGLEKDNQPSAEYWMGAHPSAPSSIEINGGEQKLNKLVQENATTFIGDKVQQKFGEFPYLLKVLDVKDMLSIQVHPGKEEAAKGFEAEEAACIPLNASNRNYKDRNHKPEVMLAVSEFWLLHGFRKQEEVHATLNAVPEFNFLVPVFEKEGYAGLYKEIMEMPQPRLDETLLPLVQRELSKKGELNKHEPGYWVTELYKDVQELKTLDRGIFSIYFFNIVKAQPGEAVYQGAGVPHAYLRGQNIELMANSDNVLRGGLTPKHIDVAELMKHTVFEAVEPKVLKGESINDFEKNYPCPVEDFGINSINIPQGQTHKQGTFSGEIYLVFDGSVSLSTSQSFKKGEAFFVLPSTEFSITANEHSVLYKAFVPSLN